jgi:hypothetical protein
MATPSIELPHAASVAFLNYGGIGVEPDPHSG